jgi:hypothetical protein
MKEDRTLRVTLVIDLRTLPVPHRPTSPAEPARAGTTQAMGKRLPRVSPMHGSANWNEKPLGP